MLKISSLIFPDYKDQIDRDFLRNKLNLVQNIIFSSKGKNLSDKDIQQIKLKLGPKMGDSNLYKGGSSVLFGWSFEFPIIGRVIIKPYYKRELSHLIIHYLTSLDCIKDIKEFAFTLGGVRYELAIPEVIGLARIENLSYNYPVLLTREILGKSILTYTPIITKISSVIRDVARKGIICDPYPANWKIRSENRIWKIYYVDLLSSNALSDIHSRIAQLIEELGE
ncbi:MAG: hypothetical protein EAX86_01910 [Candidatus Heimdallarchaeota archaeon]|nr:hypothetical protein [Candidatus Heimdallarchaeota archaeon]